MQPVSPTQEKNPAPALSAGESAAGFGVTPADIKVKEHIERAIELLKRALEIVRTELKPDSPAIVYINLEWKIWTALERLIAAEGIIMEKEKGGKHG